MFNSHSCGSISLGCHDIILRAIRAKSFQHPIIRQISHQSTRFASSSSSSGSPTATYNSSSSSSKSSVSHNFFLRNAPLFSYNLKAVKDGTKFLLSCQPPRSESEEASPHTLANNNNATATSTTTANNHIPFKVMPKAGHTRKLDLTLRKQFDAYLALTKPHLTVLVMLSSVCSYALSPYPATVSQLLCLTAGTSMCAGAANAINMGREPDFDKRMPRTSGRPVVRGIVSPTQAYQFATATGALGVATLYAGVNPLVAGLGALNIVLYAWTYTSLKRQSILNTWVGAVVGAIPPLMGWAAAASTLDHPAAWCLAALLYAWQFPHFNSLSHNIKDQYKNAGYVMTAYENPRLNARVALRYALWMFPICFGLSYFGVTDWYFQIDSFALNAWLSYLSFQFWNQQRKNYTKDNFPLVAPNSEGVKLAGIYAKKMFWGSVWQLPGILILALLHKKGMWDRWFNKKEDKKLAAI